MTIERRTVADAATDALRELIVSGELDVDTPLRQDELARRLGVSRTPLREAIARLANEGLVRSDPHRGAVVTRPSEQELREVYEIREALECLAGRLAVDAVTPEAIAGLRATLDEIEVAASADEWARLNTGFHMDMYRLADRDQLWQLIARIRSQSESYVRMLVATAGRSDNAQHDHRRILDALEARDADAVEAAIQAHLRGTVASLTTEGENREETGAQP